MADIEFPDAADGCYLLHVVVMQSVAGMHRQAGLFAQPHGLDNARQFLGLRQWVRRIGKVAGMDLDAGGTAGGGRVDLVRVRVDKP